MEERTKMKVLTLAAVVMYSICFASVFLFIPRIITAIVEQMHPNFDEEHITAKTSTLKSFSDAANSLVSLFAVPILGSVSDVFGRKKIMVFGAVAEIFYLTCLLGAYTFKWLWMVYLSSLFHVGMAVHLGAIAFMTDISQDDQEKTRNFSQVMAAFMGGLIIGSAVLGFAANENLQLSIFALICWSIVLVIYILFALKESPTFFEDEKREKKFSIKNGNPFQAMKLIFATSPYIAVLGVIYALNFLSLSDVMNSGYLYAQYRYGWGSLGNGLASALRGLSGVLWQAIGVALLLKVVPRHYILTAAMFASALIHITQGVTWNGWVYLTAAIIGGFASIAFPLLQSLVSDAVSKEKQGLALGGLSSVMSVSMLVGALLSENLFALCLSGDGYFSCPGTPYFVSALTLIAGGFICLFLFTKYPPPPTRSSSTPSLLSSTSFNEGYTYNDDNNNNDKDKELVGVNVVPPEERGSAQL